MCVCVPTPLTFELVNQSSWDLVLQVFSVSLVWSNFHPYSSELMGSRIKVLCLRLQLLPSSAWSTEDSLILEVTLPPTPTTEPSSPETTFPLHSESDALDSPNELKSIMTNTSYSSGNKLKWVGWERNDRGKFGPRMMNLSSSMDPVKWVFSFHYFYK